MENSIISSLIKANKSSLKSFINFSLNACRVQLFKNNAYSVERFSAIALVLNLLQNWHKTMPKYGIYKEKSENNVLATIKL